MVWVTLYFHHWSPKGEKDLTLKVYRIQIYYAFNDDILGETGPPDPKNFKYSLVANGMPIDIGVLCCTFYGLSAGFHFLALIMGLFPHFWYYYWRQMVSWSFFVVARHCFALSLYLVFVLTVRVCVRRSLCLSRRTTPSVGGTRREAAVCPLILLQLQLLLLLPSRTGVGWSTLCRLVLWQWGSPPLWGCARKIPCAAAAAHVAARCIHTHIHI